MVKNSAGRSLLLTGCMILLLVMSGCLYPEDQTPGQNATVHGTVMAMQDAVERYQEATGVLPIQNADASVPVYEKYRIDFAKMQRMGYVESIPKLAFENGGSYVFLIIDEETKPQVKLLDLSVHQIVGDVQKKVDEYRRDHGGRLPVEGEAYPGFSYLSFRMLNLSQPKATSMYSHSPLELMADGEGNVYADYGIDIAGALKKEEAPPTATEDLRHRLVNVSDFVPVKAPVYRYVNDGPQAVEQ